MFPYASVRIGRLVSLECLTRAARNTGSNTFGRDHSSAPLPEWSFCSVRRRAHPSGLSASVGWSGRRAPGDMNQRLRLLPIQVFITSVSLALICSGSVRREGAPVVGSRTSSTCPVRGLYVPNIFWIYFFSLLSSYSWSRFCTASVSPDLRSFRHLVPTLLIIFRRALSAFVVHASQSLMLSSNGGAASTFVFTFSHDCRR